jgi:MFS family permease
MSLIALAVVAVVFAHWGLTAKDALGRGIFNFDSLWYHLPFATDIAQTHSVTAFHHTETVFVNWFYPQNSELLHATGILLTGRDTLSLFLNFGWLAMAFLAAWCVGRPYGRGPLCVVAAAIVLESHTLVVREPGAAKNDLMAAALLLAAIAILVNAWAAQRKERSLASDVPGVKHHSGRSTPGTSGWALAAAGLAAGLAVGTKSTAVAMAAALTVAIVFLAPPGRRWAAFGWWLLPALAGGGYWYLRNLVASGNPLPQLEHLGPISLPHPERLQSGRPDFSVVHYATDTGVWHEYFAPGLHQAFGALWPLVLVAAIAGALLALIQWRNRLLRWLGGVALFGLLAYLFTPLSAAGAEGAPVGFAINIRYAIPALLAGLVLLPLAPVFASRSNAPARDVPLLSDPYGHLKSGTSLAGWILLGGLLVVWLATDRPDAVLRDPDRLFAWLVALLAVLVPASLLLARRWGAPIARVAGGFAVLGLAAVAIGYPIQRDYLRDRYLNDDLETAIPGMHLDSAYRWARGVDDSRIGLAGTTAGFLEYGFYGTDLSNRVRYLGRPGPHGAFDAIPACREFRAAVDAADLDYLVTSPLLNFIHPGDPIASPEAGWLRGEPAVRPILRRGLVTVWRVRGRLDPAACGPRNALRYVPQQPG